MNDESPEGEGFPLTTPERPIEKSSKDALDRDQFVARLCRALIDEKTERSTGVVVEIAGPWGRGKSSVLNLLDKLTAYA